MPTAVTQAISRQLVDAYTRTQRELAENPDMLIQVWDEQLTKLQGIDLDSATFPEFVEAYASVSILVQTLVAVSGRANFFNGQNR